MLDANVSVDLPFCMESLSVFCFSSTYLESDRETFSRTLPIIPLDIVVSSNLIILKAQWAMSNLITLLVLLYIVVGGYLEKNNIRPLPCKLCMHKMEVVLHGSSLVPSSQKAETRGSRTQVSTR